MAQFALDIALEFGVGLSLGMMGGGSQYDDECSLPPHSTLKGKAVGSWPVAKYENNFSKSQNYFG